MKKNNNNNNNIITIIIVIIIIIINNIDNINEDKKKSKTEKNCSSGNISCSRSNKNSYLKEFHKVNYQKAR